MQKEATIAALSRLKDDRLSWQEKLNLRREIIQSAGHAIPELVHSLEHETDIGLRIELLNIIGATGNEAFEEPLQRLLGEPDEPIEVLQMAAVNLGKLASGGSFETLVELLSHPSLHLRLGAIDGLVSLGDERAVKYLADRLDDHSEVEVWWASPKAGGYVISREAALAIDQITAQEFKGDRELISAWLNDHQDD